MSKEIKMIINKFEDKTPDESGIRMTVMPRPGSDDRKTKGNLQLVTFEGLFPGKLKNEVIIIIPKAGKDPRKVENDQSISLLEISGKIFEIINNRITS